MERKVYYPIDSANFEDIRKEGKLYVDKTGYIHQLLASKCKYYFLARPRRFGKSLFLDTMAQYFKGNRELFKGLAIDSLDTEEWETYPVLKFSMTGTAYNEEKDLLIHIGNQLERFELQWLGRVSDSTIFERFSSLISSVKIENGNKVVVLIDEYDAPLTSTIGNSELQEKFRNILHGFYSILKENEEYLHFCFITGVTRYGKLSVFSGLNNLVDITFNDEYAAICGVTKEELKENYKEGVEELAVKEGLTIKETFELLKLHYDGYHFSEAMVDIYNPFSLNYALNYSKIDDYWCKSGTPTIVVKSLLENDYDIKELIGKKVDEAALSNLSMYTGDPVPLFYQTGYLTLKDYEPRRKRYTLGYPNREVETGILKTVLNFYTKKENRINIVYDLEDAFEEGNPEKFIKILGAFLADIPLDLRRNASRYENYYHTIFYCIVKLIGLDIHAEYATSEGYIDILVKTKDYIYIVELKVNGDAEDAMNQIRSKRYYTPFEADKRELYMIGIGFSKETGSINSSIIEKKKD